MKVAYTNMELVSRILSPQQSDIAHINNTLVHSHRVFNAGLQIYFVLAIFILLSAGTNLVLCNAKAWFILYGLVAFMCLSSSIIRRPFIIVWLIAWSRSMWVSARIKWRDSISPLTSRSISPSVVQPPLSCFGVGTMV